MNPLLLSAAFGLAKGLAEEPGKRSSRLDATTHLVAPVIEEVAFRVVPSFAGAPASLAAAAFTADHVLRELPNHTPASLAWRFADTATGAYLYQAAFKRFGFLGAVAAHVAHNIAVSAGRRARAPASRRRQ